LKSIQSYLNLFLFAVYAGAIIGFGGIVYLSVSSPLAGAFLFNIGLLAIILFGFELFTGKVSYLVINPPSYLLDLGVVWFGNLTGTALTALAVRSTRLFSKLDRVYEIVDTKLSDSLLSSLILGIFCGVMMFVAVDSQKETNSSNPVLKAAGVFLPIMIFILSGFNHVVADMFYLSLSGRWSAEAVVYLLVVTLGNALGSVIFAAGKYRFRRPRT
jgi:formate/nitrite transporter FocA (FNT family)